MTPEGNLNFAIQTRQKADRLFGPTVPLEAGATWTSDVREVAGYGLVSFLVVSDQPFTLRVEEAVTADGPWVQTLSQASVVDAGGSGNQQVCLQVTPCGLFMRAFVNNGAAKETVLDVAGFGLPVAGGGAGGGSGPTTPESLEQARAVGDTFTGGDVFFDDSRAAVFGKASGEANQDFLRIFSDKTNVLQVINSAADGGGTVRPISIQIGGVQVLGINASGATVTGKLTVTGPIDPTSVSLSGTAEGANVLYFDSANGQAAPVSAASHARIRYNDTAKAWQQSIDGGAYGPFGAGGPGTDTTAWHNTGDAYGPGAIFGTTSNQDITIKTNNTAWAVWSKIGTLFLGTDIGPYDAADPESLNLNGTRAGKAVRMFAINNSAAAGSNAAVIIQNDSTGSLEPINGGLIIFGTGGGPVSPYVASEIVLYAGGFSPGVALINDSGDGYQRFVFRSTGEAARFQRQTNGLLSLLMGTTTTTYDGMIQQAKNANDNLRALSSTNTTDGTASSVDILFFGPTSGGNQRYMELLMTAPSFTTFDSFENDQVTLYAHSTANGLAITTSTVATGGGPIKFNPAQVLAMQLNPDGTIIFEGPGGGGEYARIKTTAGFPALLIGVTSRGPGFDSQIECTPSRDAGNYFTVGNPSNTSGASAAYNLWFSDAKYAQFFMEPTAGFSGSGFEADQVGIYAQGYPNGISLLTNSTYPIKFKTNALTRMTVEGDGGVLVGAATGGSQGAGTINVATDIFKNGVAYANPKWVLQHHYTGGADKEGPYAAPKEYGGLMNLEAHEEVARAKHDLPLMLLRPRGGYMERGDLLLASVEEAYLYIYQLHRRVKELEARISAA